ncbi:hypothetical protein IKF40_00175 [Candidatus Saccharibacteria bacterium]|nr:hypothetical protein [Candidatus Saccharibacteria bacterium]
MSPKSVRLELKNSLKTMRASARMSRDARKRAKSTQNPAVFQDVIVAKKPVSRLTKRRRSATPRMTLMALFRSDAKRPKLTEADLINAESALGGTLFGKVPEGHRREFFRFRHNVWIYHESWTGKKDEKLETTITYEVRENGVFKLPLGGKYTRIEGAELENFKKAVKEYLKIIKAKLY